MDAINNYAEVDNGAGWWWLRSEGIYSYDAADVDNDGNVDSDGNYVPFSFYMARPVIVVSGAALDN